MSAALAALTSVASESESDACDSLSADSLNELPSGRLGIHYRQAKGTLASIRPWHRSARLRERKALFGRPTAFLTLKEMMDRHHGVV
jgi:hypothetical protein